MKFGTKIFLSLAYLFLIPTLVNAQPVGVTPQLLPGETSYDNAMRRVLTDPAAGCINPAQPRDGCRITFPCGTFRFDSTLHISRSHIIQGSGRCTNLQFARYAGSGIVMHNSTVISGGFRSSSPTDPAGGPASYGEIRDLQLTIRSSAATPTVAHGIVIRAAYTTISNVEIAGFPGHGIFYDCDVNRGSNCNLAKLDRVRVIRNWWSGVFGRGGDFNASQFELVDASANCEQPTFSTQNPAICANMVDLGFLGNTWVAPHMDSSGTRIGFFSRNGSASTLILGGYTENTERRNAVWDTTAMVIGGNFNQTEGNAFRQRGRVITSGLSLRNTADPNNLVQLDLGMALPTSGHTWSLAWYGNSFANSPRRLALRSTIFGDATLARFDVDLLNTAQSLNFVLRPSLNNPLLTRGRAWAPQGLLVNNPPLVGTSTVAPRR